MAVPFTVLVSVKSTELVAAASTVLMTVGSDSKESKRRFVHSNFIKLYLYRVNTQ